MSRQNANVETITITPDETNVYIYVISTILVKILTSPYLLQKQEYNY